MAVNNQHNVMGRVFNIQRFSLHDGRGIRTLVFLKGCPLKCLWCDNPESISPHPELGFSKTLCNCCGECVLACPEQAISLDTNGFPRVDHGRCTACGKCVDACVPKALTIYGEERSAIEVFEEVKRDLTFYRSSGGGVTVSGGEALMQPSFVIALLKLCREAGISTAIETSGYARSTTLQKVLKYLDFIFYDIKCIDTEEHRRLTGKSNELILANAGIVVSSKVEHQFRLPLVPGFTDGMDKIEEIAHFLRDLEGSNASIEVMPYHRLGIGKYEALDRSYSLDHLCSATPEDAGRAQQAFEKLGVKCLLHG